MNEYFFEVWMSERDHDSGGKYNYVFFNSYVITAGTAKNALDYAKDHYPPAGLNSYQIRNLRKVS